MDKLDRHARDSGVGHCSSMKEVLMDYLEKKEEVAYRKARAAMDVWLGRLAVALELGGVYSDMFFLPKAGGRYLLTCNNCLPWTGHKDFEHARKGCQSIFLVLTGAEVTSSWLCLGSQNFVHYSEKDKKNLAGILKMEEV